MMPTREQAEHAARRLDALPTDDDRPRGLFQLNTGGALVGRTYLERGQPVEVLIQWGLKNLGQTYGGPRNVMIRRADGSVTVRPFRGLRKP